MVCGLVKPVTVKSGTPLCFGRMYEPDTTLSVKYEPQFVQRHFRLTSGASPFPIATMSALDSSRCRRQALHQTISRGFLDCARSGV